MTGPTRPPFDSELGAVLASVRELLPPSVTAELIPAIREGDGVTALTVDLTRDGLVGLEELDVPGPEGAPDVSLLVMRPGSAVAGGPAVYFIHGGGMVAGNNQSHLEYILDTAVEIGAVVVSVEYRLAPEHPDPAPVEDCYAGLVWTHANADRLGIDPDRIMVGGVSAGGGLAAGVALLARDREGPPLVAQLLVCPMLDDRFVTPSSGELVGEGVWDSVSNTTGWTALLGERCGGDDVSVYAAPARASDLTGLPPAFVDVGSVETFRDEDVDYATRLSQAGVSTELHVWPGGFHGFELLAPTAALSMAASATRAAWVRRTLG